MSLRSSIWDRLSVIPELAGYGVYPDALVEKEPFPAVVFVFENIRGLYTLDGPVNVGTGAVSFSVYSYDKNDCASGIDGIKASFNGFTGPMESIIVRNAMKLLDESDSEYAAPDGSSKVLFEMKQVYSLDYRDDIMIASSAPAPASAPYIIQAPAYGLVNAQALSQLTTGLMKSTSGTGVVSIATPGVDYAIPGAGGGQVSLPVGGSPGQVLAKITSTDNDAGWSSDPLLDGGYF